MLPTSRKGSPRSYSRNVGLWPMAEQQVKDIDPHVDPFQETLIFIVGQHT